MREEKFRVGDAVRVVPGSNWKPGAQGVVSSWPTDEGTIVREIRQSGAITRYLWILFEEEQEDADGDGPYIAGQVSEEHLESA